MVGLAPGIASVRNCLLNAGFRQDRLCAEWPMPDWDGSVPLVGFSDRPFDARTACIAVVEGRTGKEPEIAGLRPLGAPLVFSCMPGHFELWTQRAARPAFQRHFTPAQLPRFFDEHRQELSPGAIYRAKVWGRLDRSAQLDFVDAGLMPLVEEEAGRKLTALVERVTAGAKRRLGWTKVPDPDGRWLLQSTFWLLAAKVLRDKGVPGFVRLTLTDVEEVYDRLARHYNRDEPRPVRVGGRMRRGALVAAAEEIARFGHCGCVSTEALAYLYESALIDRVTRSRLGTHSTPTWLVDYVIGKLRPWIEHEIPVAQRRVFEPACGHAAFLMSAMRLLTELLPADWREPRRAYLRRRLHGLEIDPFALEIARLSLTLADVPNPDGWALTEADMFPGGRIEQAVGHATIVLGNPPFEDFGAKQRRPGWLPNKAAEVFRRVVDHLPSGGVFGFVLPQTFLHSKQAAGVRETLLRDYEISEVSLFADKVFRYGESESSVVIGRRLPGSTQARPPVRYHRVREGQIEEFSRTYEPANAESVPVARFVRSGAPSLFVPDLAAVWEALAELPKLEEFADLGKGFEHKSEKDPTLPPGTVRESTVEVPGLTPGFARWPEQQMTHDLPPITWLNLTPDAIGCPRRGTATGIPQVLLNYARVSREAWRLKALPDPEGHPVTTRFIVVRPRRDGPSLPTLWAILNSPIGNSFAYCMSGKRDVLAGTIRKMPVPDFHDCNLTCLEQSVAEYLKAVRTLPRKTRPDARKDQARQDARQKELFADAPSPAGEVSPDHLRTLHWRIDAEVLRLYGLPAALERKVLDLFAGIRRRGVPFEQTAYFPKGFTDLDRLSDLLAITADWPKTNRRRARLIDLEEAGQLTPAQAEELEHLQRLADARVSLVQPVQLEGADRLIEDLKRRGQWEE